MMENEALGRGRDATFSLETPAYRIAEKVLEGAGAYIDDMVYRFFNGSGVIDARETEDVQHDSYGSMVLEMLTGVRVPVMKAGQEFLRKITGIDRYVYGATDGSRVFVDSGIDETDPQYQITLAHEAGHLIDPDASESAVEAEAQRLYRSAVRGGVN